MKLIFRMLALFLISVILLIAISTVFFDGRLDSQSSLIFEIPLIFRLIVGVGCGFLLSREQPGFRLTLCSFLILEALLVGVSLFGIAGWNGFYYLGFPIVMPIYDGLGYFGLGCLLKSKNK